jgi:nicotinamide riboside kinase
MAKIKIAICGGPSSGKTTLARALTNKLCMSGFNADYVTEYARAHINECRKHGIVGTKDLIDEQLILDGQLEWEDTVSDDVEYLVTDSPIFITAIYCSWFADWSNYKHRKFYYGYYKRILEMKDRYQHIFFLPSEIEFKADGTRSQDAQAAKQVGERIRAFLVYHMYPWQEIRGTLDERLEQCYRSIVLNRGTPINVSISI